MAKPEPPPLDTAELRLLASREKEAQRKREERARTARERAQAADVPAAVPLPPMPASLTGIRRWLRLAFDQYERGQRSSARLEQARAQARTIGDMARAEAETTKAKAAMLSAKSSERIADALAAFEHGGAVVGLVTALRAGDAALGGAPRPRLPRPTTALSVRRPDGDGA